MLALAQAATKESTQAKPGQPASSAGIPEASALVLQRKTCPCGGGCPRCQREAEGEEAIQTKLTVGPVDDQYELEADRIADRVMRTPDAGSWQPAAGAESNQVQMKTPGGAPAPSIAPPIVHRALRSPGQPAAPATRAFMESRFARDFSRVRIHTGSEASASAAAISAKAYTSGNDIVFGAGQYRPETQEGRRLLAHELAHVVQQNSAEVASVQRSPYDPWAARKSIVKIVAFAKRTGDAMAYVSTTDPPSVGDSQNHATESVRVVRNELDAGEYTLTQTENGDYEGAPGVFTWVNPWADPETGPQTHLPMYDWAPKVEVTVLDKNALSVTGLMAFDPHACGGQKCFSEQDIPEIRELDQRKIAEAEEEKKRQEEGADQLYTDLIALRSTILKHQSLFSNQIQDLFLNHMDARAWGIMKRYGCSWPSSEAHQQEFKDCLVNAINQFDDYVHGRGSGPWMRALTDADIKALKEQQEKDEMLKSMAQGYEASVASPLGAIMGGVARWFTDDEKKIAGWAGFGEATEGVTLSGAPMVEAAGNRQGGGGTAPDIDPITEMKEPEPPMPTPDPIEGAADTSGAVAGETGPGHPVVSEGERERDIEDPGEASPQPRYTDEEELEEDSGKGAPRPRDTGKGKAEPVKESGGEEAGREKTSYRQERVAARNRAGSALGFSRAELDAIRGEIIARPRAQAPVARGHAGALDHRVPDDIVIETINNPQVVLATRNGNWVFYRTGTIVVTPANNTQFIHTAFGNGGFVPQRRLADLRILYNQPTLRAGDPERAVSLDDWIAQQAGDFAAVKVWP